MKSDYGAGLNLTRRGLQPPFPSNGEEHAHNRGTREVDSCRVTKMK